MQSKLAITLLLLLPFVACAGCTQQQPQPIPPQNITLQMAVPEVQPMAENVAPLQTATPPPEPVPEATFATPDAHRRQYLDMPTSGTAAATPTSASKKITSFAVAQTVTPLIPQTPAKDPIIGTWVLKGFSEGGSATILTSGQGTLTVGTPPCDYMDVPFSWKNKGDAGAGGTQYQITLSDNNGQTADALLDSQGRLTIQIPMLPDGAYFVKEV